MGIEFFASIVFAVGDILKVGRRMRREMESDTAGDLTIENIAEECGFISRSYFQTLFKTETGFTPREWRVKMCGS